MQHFKGCGLQHTMSAGIRRSITCTFNQWSSHGYMHIASAVKGLRNFNYLLVFEIKIKIYLKDIWKSIKYSEIPTLKRFQSHSLNRLSGFAKLACIGKILARNCLYIMSINYLQQLIQLYPHTGERQFVSSIAMVTEYFNLQTLECYHTSDDETSKQRTVEQIILHIPYDNIGIWENRQLFLGGFSVNQHTKVNGNFSLSPLIPLLTHDTFKNHISLTSD